MGQGVSHRGHERLAMFNRAYEERVGMRAWVRIGVAGPSFEKILQTAPPHQERFLEKNGGGVSLARAPCHASPPKKGAIWKEKLLAVF